MVSSFSRSDLTAILPEILLLILIGIVLVVDAFKNKEKSNNLIGWITLSGLVLIILFNLLFFSPGNEAQTAWGGMIRVDSAVFIFQILILIGASITILFSMDHSGIRDRGPYYCMLLLSLIGMSFMASATNIILLYLAIETTTVPLYVLVGFMTKDVKSTEGSLKYFLFNAFTSAIMLYGFSLLYGFSGSTYYADIMSAIKAGSLSAGTALLVLLLVIVGFGAKVSAFPFHFWAPDAYQGAPTPITGYLSTASKAIGFIVIMRFLTSVFSPDGESWKLLLALISLSSMLVGNLLALVQKDLKRLFAYSSIAHAGYVLIGVATGTALGFQAAMYYLIAYLFTNLAVFGVIHIVENTTKTDHVDSFRGLIRRSPGIAFMFLIAVLSLAGIPPFGGFFSKVMVFLSAMEAGLIWLLIVGIVNTFIALYYYLNVLRITFADGGKEEPLTYVHSGWKVALGICVIGIIILGVWFTPWFNALDSAAINLVLLN